MLDFCVKIRYNPLLPCPPQISRPSVLQSPATLSLFAQKRVFAPSSFPGTYSLFQSEDPRNRQQSKGFVHSFAKHRVPNLCRAPEGRLASSRRYLVTSLLPLRTRRNCRNPFPLMGLRTLACAEGVWGTSASRPASTLSLIHI